MSCSLPCLEEESSHLPRVPLVTASPSPYRPRTAAGRKGRPWRTACTWSTQRGHSVPLSGPRHELPERGRPVRVRGIEAVLDQMRRKTMKAGFEFNVMVVGQSGLGKSTLVNTLFKSRVSRKSCSGVHQEKIPKTVRIHQVSHMIEEKGVKMKLTVVDTPGFGDHINNNNCWEPIVSYVNEQYERYLREELNVTRKPRIPDTRVHCCVYFLPPTGHRLRSIDVEFMKHLGSIVSIVPVIAKADTLTLDERLDFKHRIRQDLVANGIQVYPQKQYDEDPEERLLNSSIRECIPFAVVGTDREHQVNGHKVLGRKTKWGIIEVENIAHCEFSHLRDLLIRSVLRLAPLCLCGTGLCTLPVPTRSSVSVRDRSL
uniref:Septin-7 n=1 Tax=Neogobius melanostomus TaxID=47308 RepID=A0A8C6SAF9_9GOBI